MKLYTDLKKRTLNSISFIFDIPIIGHILGWVLNIVFNILMLVWVIGAFPSLAFTQYILYLYNVKESETSRLDDFLTLVIMFIVGISIWIGMYKVANSLGIRPVIE